MHAHTSDAPTRPDLPEGELALVFTDIEGSTQLLQSLGPEYPAQLAAHRRILRACFDAHGGVEVDTQGDAFFVVFREMKAAINAAVQAQRELHNFEWLEGFALRVRIGLHWGEPQRTNEGYVGLDLHRCARLMSAGYGGQILLSGAAAQRAGALNSALELRDLGAHCLKDLPHPERIFELRIEGLPTDFPPLRTIDNRPHNLPLHLSPIVGRECEITALRSQLQADARLITLLGPGGTGKTRLSLAVAAATRDLWQDGVFFVQLAPIVAPDCPSSNQIIEEAIASAVARELGVRDEGSQSLAQQLIRHLEERQLLLILDNFEHLVDGAGVVAQWLARCPKLAILVSSRIPLHLHGEQQFLVSPLALPQHQSSDVADLLRFGALKLFVERASAVQPNFVLDQENAPVIAEICARLDGLPLAIELAAARIKLLPPKVLLKRLDDSLNFLTGRVRDGLAHHQTLRAAIAWSYDLLSDDEKLLFRRLSVFRGGFNLEGAEQVCAANEAGETLDVFEGVASLLDQSLVGRRNEVEGEPRYAMLETIRQFACEMLEASDEEEELRQRHSQWCLDAVYAHKIEMRHALGRALRLFKADADNWRAAWNWSIKTRPEQALRMASEAAFLWNRSGSTIEHYQRLETSLRAAPHVEAKYQCRALHYLVQANRNRANWQQYGAFLQQLEQLSQEADLPEFQAIALDQRMWDTIGQREPLKALEIGNRILELHRESVARARQQQLDADEITRREDELLDAMILHVEVLCEAGEMDAAWTLMEKSLAAKRASGDEGGLHLALCKYAQLLALAGRHDEARPFAEELVERVKANEDRSLSLAFYLHDAAEIVIQQGDLARALELLNDCYFVCAENASTLGFLLVLRDLAALHAKAGHWPLFARLLGAMDVTGDWNSSGNADARDLPPDSNEETACVALGAAEFEAQRAKGMRMGTHAVIQAALQHEWLSSANGNSDVCQDERSQESSS